ncbi:IolE/MocC family protein [Ornithinibacillus californiensis]|uniref:hypothetical protein n=1 Tax=Ornithinibacillus californiensis TaxID=161536 RepID=UPI00064DFA0D|nr:hypothetical protein [Ornithinibacillus californiensis]
MKQTNILFFCVSVVLILISGCSQQSDIDMSKTLEQWRASFEGAETVAAAFDGEKDIKLRMMVENQLTEEEAFLIFQEMLDSIDNYSNHSGVWTYYNGYFDIISYDDGVIYEATKRIGEDLVIKSRE